MLGAQRLRVWGSLQVMTSRLAHVTFPWSSPGGRHCPNGVSLPVICLPQSPHCNPLYKEDRCATFYWEGHRSMGSLSDWMKAASFQSRQDEEHSSIRHLAPAMKWRNAQQRQQAAVTRPCSARPGPCSGTWPFLSR